VKHRISTRSPYNSSV